MSTEAPAPLSTREGSSDATVKKLCSVIVVMRVLECTSTKYHMRLTNKSFLRAVEGRVEAGAVFTINFLVASVLERPPVGRARVTCSKKCLHVGPGGREKLTSVS